MGLRSLLETLDMHEPFNVFSPLEIVSVEDGYGFNPGCLIEITGREGMYEIVHRQGNELAIRPSKVGWSAGPPSGEIDAAA